MSDTPDYSYEPLDGHEHRFFIHSINPNVYEPSIVGGEIIYHKREYAYSGCNCGAAIRTLVKRNDENGQS